MTVTELKELFVKHSNEYLKFDRVVDVRTTHCPDMHAFLLLDRLVPGTKRMVSCAEHDEIFLEVEPSRLAEVVSEDQIIDLIRCGVRLVNGSLAMFI